jgi:cell division protein FtsB
MKILIKHLTGTLSGKSESFDSTENRELLVGRDAECAVKYDEDRDDLVSHQHLKIIANPSSPSGFNIVDLKSRNGTFVNRQRVATSACLKHLDVVQLGAGGPEFRVEYDPPPVVASRPTRVAENDFSSARMTREASLPVSAVGTRPVGRLTVERMLGESFQKVKRESNKALWVGVVGIVVVLGLAAGLFFLLKNSSEESARRAAQQQVLLQKLDDQAKAAPAEEAQLKAQIAQLGEQLKAAQTENKKEFSQLAHAENGPPITALSQTSATSEAYDKQLQVAVQQFANNDLPGTMKTCAALIRLDGNRWEAYALAARALNGANKQAQAKTFFLKAQELAPADVKPTIQQMIDKLGTQSPS